MTRNTIQSRNVGMKAELARIGRTVGGTAGVACAAVLVLLTCAASAQAQYGGDTSQSPYGYDGYVQYDPYGNPIYPDSTGGYSGDSGSQPSSSWDGYEWADDNDPQGGYTGATAATSNYALCIGINQYATGSTPLHGCVNDANGLAAALTNDAARWPAANVTLLTDAGATKDAIRTSLYTIGQYAGPGDVCLYYHSSHGGQNYGTSAFIVAYDDYYSDEELGYDLAQFFSTQTKIIVILDTCFSGGMFKTDASGRVSPQAGGFAFAQNVMAAYQNAVGEGLAKDAGARTRALGSNIGFITASDYDETSSEYNGSGLFTGQFVSAFVSAGVDTNADQLLSFWELYSWAAPRVSVGQTAQSLNESLLSTTIAAKASASSASAAGMFAPAPIACGAMGGSLPLMATIGLAAFAGTSAVCGRRRPRRS